jgi:hypothetical protein
MQRESIERCKAKDHWLNDAKCSQWLQRRDYLRHASCPDSDAVAACRSFQELLEAGDVDFMDDLATKDHIYFCFESPQDVFFEVWFNEPDLYNWKTDGTAARTAHQEMALPDNVLVQMGVAGFVYYVNGVFEDTRFVDEPGFWTYLPTNPVTAESLKRLATSSNAAFDGKKIRIENARALMSNSYRDGDSTIHQNVMVQLSTGRFRETAKGSVSVEKSGRCIEVRAEKR